MSGKKNRQYPKVRPKRVPDRRQSGLSQDTPANVWKANRNQRAVVRAYMSFLDEGNAYRPINHPDVVKRVAAECDLQPRTVQGWNEDPNWCAYVDQVLMERSANMRGQVFAAMHAIVNDPERSKDKDRIAAAKVILDNLPSNSAKGEADLASLMASLKAAPEGSEIQAMYEAGEDVGRIRFEMKARKFRNRESIERFQNAGEQIGAVESKQTKDRRLAKAAQMLEDVKNDFARKPFYDCEHSRKVCDTCRSCTRWARMGFKSMAEVKEAKKDGRLIRPGPGKRWVLASKVKAQVELVQDAEFTEVKGD